MKAIVIKGPNRVELTEVPTPEKALPNHLIVRMQRCAINSGDKTNLSGKMPASAFSKGGTGTLVRRRKYNMCGASGVGTVIETGEGAPEEYKGKNVTVYVGLKQDEETIGTWCEYAHLHYMQCAILPDNVNTDDYSGSLVNIITPYAFLKQAQQESHRGIISTAGNSATGIALLGICRRDNVPVISLVRNAENKKELEDLGAQHVLIENAPNFKADLQKMAFELSCTAVFDGVGGALISNILDVLPFGSTIYCYGFLDKQNPVTFYSASLMNGLTIKGFSNVLTPTVENAGKLQEALRDISTIIGQPFFKTKTGKVFSFDEIDEALHYSSRDGKAALAP